MEKTSLIYRFLRRIYHFLRTDILFNVLLLPYGRWKHKRLLATSVRKNDHAYTCFYRSPIQLEALTGPVLNFLGIDNNKPITINIFAGANGAEAYTIASVLISEMPDLDFHIYSSELHQELVDKSISGTYSFEEITRGKDISQTFMEKTFETLKNNQYQVKPHIKARITFSQADLLSQDIRQKYRPAEIIFAQNVLFHLPPAMARKAFSNIVSLLKPRSALFIDGMELDMRVELAKQHGLLPLNYKVKEIYKYSRVHIYEKWWNLYYGNEPYFPLSRDKFYRYTTIFLKQ